MSGRSKSKMEGMAIKILAEVREAMTEIARRFGRLGGKTAAKNMTPEERLAQGKESRQSGCRDGRQASCTGRSEARQAGR